ncbi:MAG: GAF domain-containing protein [Piscinibacter sp.]|nr:GAF domain-containing protein [Piscinibacter sp.]
MVNLVDLQTLCGQLDRREVTPAYFMEMCTRMMAATVGCSRTGIWLFEGEGEQRRLRCLCLYDSRLDGLDKVPDEAVREVGTYFEMLERTGYVLANDVSTHPATVGYMAERFALYDVRSLMAAAFSVNGTLYGAFTCTQQHEPANWTPRQLSALMRIGARASLALAGATSTDPPTLPMPL